MVAIIATVSVVLFSVIFFIAVFILSNAKENLHELRSSALYVPKREDEESKETIGPWPALDISGCSSFISISWKVSEHVSQLNVKIEQKISEARRSDQRMRAAKSQLACMNVQDCLAHVRYQEKMAELRRDMSEAQRACKQLQEEFKNDAAAKAKAKKRCGTSSKTHNVIKQKIKVTERNSSNSSCSSETIRYTHKMKNNWSPLPKMKRSKSRQRKPSLKSCPCTKDAPCSSMGRR